jgi:hypothetical protein
VSQRTLSSGTHRTRCLQRRASRIHYRGELLRTYQRRHPMVRRGRRFESVRGSARRRASRATALPAGSVRDDQRPPRSGPHRGRRAYARVRLDDRPPGGPRARRHRDDRLEARGRRYEPDAAPREHPARRRAFVINTHLHFDHCGATACSRGCRSTSRHASWPMGVHSTTTRSENGSTSTARRMLSTRGRLSCYRESACCRRPGIRTGIRWSSSRPTPARTFSEGRGHLVRRARQRHDRGTASRARARSADVALPRAGAEDPGTSPVGDGPPPATGARRPRRFPPR